MLKSLDVLIGIALVMLVVSMVVTILTQFVMSVINSHGRNLRNGLQNLLSQIDPALEHKLAGRVADAVLRHPLVGAQSSLRRLVPSLMRKNTLGGEGFTLGAVIHRHELTKILLELGSGKSPVKVDKDVQDALQAALAANGIPEPGNVLDNIRSVSLALEESHPELANNVRADMAILQEAKSKFVGKLNGWFDQTIDRVAEQFTMSARGIAFVCALIVAVAIQLDAIHLLNTLWTNDIVRQDLVAEAAKLAPQAAPSPSAVTPVVTNPGAPNFDQEDLQKLSDFALNGLIVLPWPDLGSGAEAKTSPTFADCVKQWRTKWQWPKIPGIALSAFLLSLGAPFWYNALKTLLRMRSALADKDDAQRTARQSDGPVNPAPIDADDKSTNTSPPPRLTADLPGERGDLSAIG